MRFLASAFEDLGYKWVYRIIDARAFGLPQRRRRVYFVASRSDDPRCIIFADEAGPIDHVASAARVACGFYWTEGIRGLGWAIDSIPTLKGGSTIGIPSSPAILLSDGNVVTLDIRDAERLQGFPSNWTRPAEAVTKKSNRWRLIGNAVSVSAAEWIGRRMAKPGAPLNLPAVELRDHSPWPAAALEYWWRPHGDRSVRVADQPEGPIARRVPALPTRTAFGKSHGWISKAH